MLTALPGRASAILDAGAAGLKKAGFTDDAAEWLLRTAGNAYNACSFSADTLVMTEDGLVPISEVPVGTLVLSYNEITGEIGYYPVVATWAHLDPVVVYLTIDGEIISTTPEHPFYTDEGVWVTAAELQIGDEIHDADWNTGTVEKIQFTASQQLMYNFTVETAHTYFVGDGKWLVHNSCPIDSIKSYYQWRYKVQKGEIQGFEIHHIIEKRFIATTDVSKQGQMLSIPLTPEQHQVFTNAWRAEFAYGKTNYNALTIDEVWEAAQRIYRDYPELLSAAEETIFGK